MDLKKELDAIDAELQAAQREYARLGARIGGLLAERDALSVALVEAGARGGAVLVTGERRTTKSRAIVEVLASATDPMRIAEIVEALRRSGRPNENYNGVSVYLDTLLKRGLVSRVGRGLYIASVT